MDCAGASLPTGAIIAPPGLQRNGWSCRIPWQPSSAWPWGTTAVMKRWDGTLDHNKKLVHQCIAVSYFFFRFNIYSANPEVDYWSSCAGTCDLCFVTSFCVVSSYRVFLCNQTVHNSWGIKQTKKISPLRSKLYTSLLGTGVDWAVWRWQQQYRGCTRCVESQTRWDPPGSATQNKRYLLHHVAGLRLAAKGDFSLSLPLPLSSL